MKVSDEELMRLLQNEAPGALEELYRRYSRALLRYFHRMLWKDENKAQDSLQDLFLKVIENKHRFDTDRKFATWLYAIAHNMCKNEYRKHEFRNDATMFLDESETQDNNYDREVFKRRLEELLTDLSDEDRTAFVLKYEMEMTGTEISAILGIPEGTVKSKLFYLKKKIAWQLRSYKTIKY